MITLEKCSKSYRKDILFSDLDISFNNSEISAIMGPSGCGKTTLLRMICGLDKEYSGTITSPFNSAAFCFQELRLLQWMSVAENILFVNPSCPLTDIDAMLEKLELREFRDRQISRLSGGQKQRAALARALLSDFPFIAADEPLNSLDYGIKFRIVSWLKEYLRKERKTVLYVTHDPFEAQQLGDTIIIMGNKPVSRPLVLKNSPALTVETLHSHLLELT